MLFKACPESNQVYFRFTKLIKGNKELVPSTQNRIGKVSGQENCPGDKEISHFSISSAWFIHAVVV